MRREGVPPARASTSDDPTGELDADVRVDLLFQQLDQARHVTGRHKVRPHLGSVPEAWRLAVPIGIPAIPDRVLPDRPGGKHRLNLPTLLLDHLRRQVKRDD
jgi:hypothetical protein